MCNFKTALQNIDSGTKNRSPFGEQLSKANRIRLHNTPCKEHLSYLHTLIEKYFIERKRKFTKEAKTGVALSTAFDHVASRISNSLQIGSFCKTYRECNFLSCGTAMKQWRGYQCS